MSYPSIANGHRCTLCNHSDLVGIIQKESLERGIFEVQKGTILKCNHAFHDHCIRNHFADGNKQCPNCPQSTFYSTGLKGQVCTICLDEENLVGSFEKSSLLHGFYIQTKGTVLKCSHAFHDICIRKHFISHDKCPNCRTEVDQDTRNFDFTIDPTSRENFEVYNKHNEEGLHTLVFNGKFTEEHKKWAQKISEKVRNGEDIPGLVKISEESFSFSIKD